MAPQRTFTTRMIKNALLPYHALVLMLGLATNHVQYVSAFGLGNSGSRGTVVFPAISRGSFVASNSATKSGPYRNRRSRPSSMSSLSMVIDRLSNECIAAVKQSHDIGNEIGLKALNYEILFAGVVAKPERARSSLEKYGITFDEVKSSAIKTLRYRSEITFDVPNPTKEALPFAPETKSILTKACEIADEMESETVRSEHVVLALMGYNGGKAIENVPIIEVLQDMPTLRNGEVSFRVSKFCDDLVNALPLTAMDNGKGGRAEAVVIGGEQGLSNTLAEVGVDLTQRALEGKLDMVFGRDKEIRSALRTLGRRQKNNPCLIGEPGVGKTAIAEGIAQVLANGLLEIQQAREENKPTTKIRSKLGKWLGGGKKDSDNQANGEKEAEEDEIEYTLPPCPKSLLGARVVNIELAGLVAGTANRGDFEKKIKSLIKEASDSNVILFIDEIHNLIGAGGGGDGAMNAANLLKPALARGELRLMGATTTPEYRRYIEKDGALERRFQPLTVVEPTVYETLDILAAVSPKYEEFHEVEYTYNALVAAAKLSNRYITDRFLPDKAIDLIDEAGSMMKMADEMADEEASDIIVTEDSIAEVISEISGIPLGKLDTGEKSRLRKLEEEMEKRIKGQSTAVRAVAKSIRRARSGMRDGKRPVANLLFCGPTGVGKVRTLIIFSHVAALFVSTVSYIFGTFLNQTELCKTLAETYYGQEKDMVRIDMSEYMDRFSTSRLIGAPPGYVGYEEGGQLTEAVRRAPHSVILFDGKFGPF